MRHIRYLLSIPLITLGMMSGTIDKTQDKTLTRLDNLAGFIHYTNPSLPYETTYHVASALLTEGGGNTLILIKGKYYSLYRVITAIAAVESDFTPSAIGDGGSSVGMMQVQPKLHGEVSTNVYEQVKQARKILLQVQKVSRYNGRGKAARVYEAKVYKITRKVVV